MKEIKKHTPNELIKLLITEYPFLGAYNLHVEKQFNTFGKNPSNTFLVSSDKKEYEKFIVKGEGYKPSSLENEWEALRLLQNKKYPVPKLLIVDHKPQDLLLIEYIKSDNAEDLIKQGDKRKIFYEIGRTTGKIHSVPLSFFGPLNNRHTEDWAAYQHEKFDRLRSSLNTILNEKLYSSTLKLIEQLSPILESDNKQPVLVHHDIYINNFLFTDHNSDAVLIDFGIAFGGRPLFDLSKFFIIDLYRYPEHTDDFLRGYKEFQVLPPNYAELMKLYIFRETLGIINYADKTKNEEFKQHGITILNELVNNRGVILNIISKCN